MPNGKTIDRGKYALFSANLPSKPSTLGGITYFLEAELEMRMVDVEAGRMRNDDSARMKRAVSGEPWHCDRRQRIAETPGNIPGTKHVAVIENQCPAAEASGWRTPAAIL